MIKVSKRLLLGFLFVALVGCEQKLRDSLDEAQANDILALLRQQGLSAEKKRDSDGTWSVELQGNGKNLADQLLHSYEVPRDARKNMLDIFPGGGLMPSEGEERIRYQSGLAEELARTLEKMDGVLSARVHVAIPLKREVNDASSISAPHSFDIAVMFGWIYLSLRSKLLLQPPYREQGEIEFLC